jgi:hypothetical protein
MHELGARRVINELQKRLDNCNVLDDSDLVDLLNEAIDEIKFLMAIAKNLYAELGR